MSTDLHHAARGISWNYLGSAVALVAQVLYTALTARLISPDGFGAYAAALALVSFVSYFALSTLGSAVIRHERHNPEVVGTAFAVTIIAGVAASIVIFFAASPWAVLWDLPESEALGRLFAIVVSFSALSVIPLALLRKSLSYRTAAVIESTSQVAGMAAGVVLAYQLRSATALVIGQTIAAGLTAALAMFVRRQELVFRFSRAEARSLLAFSGRVSLQSIVYYGLYTAPSLVISRMFGGTVLGIYSRASAIVLLPTTHLWMGVTKTLYPLVARARGDTLRLQHLIESSVVSMTGLLWPIFAAVAGAAPLLVEILLGPRFSDVAAMLPPVLVWGAINFAYVVAGNPLEVLGFQRVIWRVQLVWIVLLAIALTTGILTGISVIGLLWLVAGVQILVHGLKLQATARLGLVRLGPVMRGYAVTLAVSVLFFAVSASVERATAGLDGLVGRAALELVAMLTVAAAITYLVGTTPFARALRGAARRLRSASRSNPLVDANHAPTIEGPA